MFQALCRRRNVRLKHERFANALTASAVYNVNRGSDSPALSPFDFVREPDPQAEQTRAIKQQIRQAIGAMPCDTPKVKLLEIRERVINSLKSQGRHDAEQIWAECWPSLTPE
jgi:hypothetical protein